MSTSTTFTSHTVVIGKAHATEMADLFILDEDREAVTEDNLDEMIGEGMWLFGHILLTKCAKWSGSTDPDQYRIVGYHYEHMLELLNRSKK